VTFSPLTASVMHLVPVMRDILQWMGGREVSRESIQLALRSRRSCLLIPGGQAEMMESRSGIDEIVLVTRHTGFLRLAMQEGAKLVPVLSIGEVDLLDNVSVPGVQRWFLKRIGFAAPFNPYGVWYLPIPRPAPVTAIVGRPITVPHCAAPSETELRRAMTEYFGELQSMFDRHEEDAQAPRGLRRRRLMFLDHNGVRCDFDALRQQWAPDTAAAGASPDSPVPAAGHRTARAPRRKAVKSSR
jgi:diacylglycerol O-acyltransferase 2, plant